jgi:hypothetical protein
MTGAGRRRDLADVLDLIKLLNLPQDFAEQLDPYVRKAYVQLWSEGTRRYVTPWQENRLTVAAKTIEDMIAILRAAKDESAADKLDAMRRDGVTLVIHGVLGNERPRLVTTDPELARKYDMLEESELWEDEDDLGTSS